MTKIITTLAISLACTLSIGLSASAQNARSQEMRSLMTRTVPHSAIGYIKIDGIDGESTHEGHHKWIEILSFSSGVEQPINNASRTGGRTATRAEFSSIIFTKAVDISTPDLFAHTANGKHIAKVELVSVSGGRTYSLELEDVIVSAVNIEAGKGNTWPVEQVSLSYGKITVKYKPNAQATTIDRSWDLARNRP